MARRRRQKKEASFPAEELPRPLLTHMAWLELASVADYRAWCRRYGFSEGLGKSEVTLERERKQARAKDASRALARRRRTRDPLQALCLALDGEVDPESVEPAELRQACTMLKGLGAQRPHRSRLPELLEVVNRRAGFLAEHETIGGQRLRYLRGLITLNERRGQWRRELDDWRPRTHNRRKQFASLLRHLLAEYHVPGFLDASWMRTDKGSHRFRDLFVHVGSGGNPRTAQLPVAMTKKVAHWFLQAPESCSIEGAVRWGQVHARGGGPRLSEALAATQLGRSFAHEEFWLSVLAFFVEHPMLDVAQVGPLIDYIDHMKFRPTEVVLPDGSLERRPPPQPGLSMARRTPQSLLRQMERWHTGLGASRVDPTVAWPASEVAPLCWETGLRKKRCWTITELRSAKALRLEGQEMGHCVATYTASCAARRCSIWSMAMTSETGTDKRLTLELSRQRVIVQARGQCNRSPKQQERDVLNRWAEQEELTVASYL